MNCSTRYSFDFSSTVLLVTLVHRNYIVDLIFGLPLFDTHGIFATMECRMYDSCNEAVKRVPGGVVGTVIFSSEGVWAVWYCR